MVAEPHVIDLPDGVSGDCPDAVSPTSGTGPGYVCNATHRTLDEPATAPVDRPATGPGSTTSDARSLVATRVHWRSAWYQTSTPPTFTGGRPSTSVR
jgi:hypothetical protein